MNGLIRYIGWEILAIHALTGALFALINAIFLRALLPEHWVFALVLAPLFAWSWWGFFAEATWMMRVSRDLRRRPPAR